MRRPYFKLFLLLTAFVSTVQAILFCQKFFLPHNKQEIRQTASKELLHPAKTNIASQINNIGNGAYIWSLRSTVSSSMLPAALAEAAQFALDAPHLTARKLNKKNQPVKKNLGPLLNQDGVTPPALLTTISDLHADALDASGRPLRWVMPKNIMDSYSLPRPTVFEKPSAVPEIDPKFARALARLRPSGNASSYRSLVENQTRKYNLNADLVMAIIHSESNFQPALVSPRSAMGLMQLLPSTASDEVHRFLYGRKGQISYEQLAVPEINITYGTAYLHILFSRYFAAVRDPHIRELCVIASYNLGPNRFLRLYGSNNDLAAININKMSREEFVADLPRRLPVRETRFYVEKVKRMKEYYKNIQP